MRLQSLQLRLAVRLGLVYFIAIAVAISFFINQAYNAAWSLSERQLGLRAGDLALCFPRRFGHTAPRSAAGAGRSLCCRFGCGSIRHSCFGWSGYRRLSSRLRGTGQRVAPSNEEPELFSPEEPRQPSSGLLWAEHSAEQSRRPAFDHGRARTGNQPACSYDTSRVRVPHRLAHPNFPRNHAGDRDSRDPQRAPAVAGGVADGVGYRSRRNGDPAAGTKPSEGNRAASRGCEPRTRTPRTRTRPRSMTQGANAATMEAAVALRSTVFDVSSAIASSRATRCSTNRFIRDTSFLTLAIAPLPSIKSSAPVMIASGVRSRGQHWR